MREHYKPQTVVLKMSFEFLQMCPDWQTVLDPVAEQQLGQKATVISIDPRVLIGEIHVTYGKA